MEEEIFAVVPKLPFYFSSFFHFHFLNFHSHFLKLKKGNFQVTQKREQYNDLPCSHSLQCLLSVSSDLPGSLWSFSNQMGEHFLSLLFRCPTLPPPTEAALHYTVTFFCLPDPLLPSPYFLVLSLLFCRNSWLKNFFFFTPLNSTVIPNQMRLFQYSVLTSYPTHTHFQLLLHTSEQTHHISHQGDLLCIIIFLILHK